MRSGPFRSIAGRDGVIGINFYDRFLIPPAAHGKRRANLGDVVAHVKHMCDVIGDARHVGIGTDMDGGLGRDQIPVEIQSSADLPRIGDALSGRALPDDQTARSFEYRLSDAVPDSPASRPGRSPTSADRHNSVMFQICPSFS